MSSQQTFMILNGADADFGLAIRGDKVVVALSSPLDPYQLWIRIDSGSRDEEGQPTFALVNKGSNEAIRHDAQYGPPNLVPYTAGSKDITMFWSESKNGDNGFKYIRRAALIRNHFTPNSHMLEDGRLVDLTDGFSHISEQWKLVPYSSKDGQQAATKQTVKISCLSKPGYNLTIRKDTVVLAPADSKDKNQIWIKDTSYGKQVKDEDKQRSFALVNRATGKAISHGFGSGYLAQLARFDTNYLDPSLLWTENEKANGFREIRMQSNKSSVLHAFYVNDRAYSKSDITKPLLALRGRNDGDDQRWKFEEIIVPDAAEEDAKPADSNQWNPSKADVFFSID